MTNSSQWKLTGPAVSLIREQTFRKVYPELSLQLSHTISKTYTEERKPVLGELKYQSSTKANRNSKIWLSLQEMAYAC